MFAEGFCSFSLFHSGSPAYFSREFVLQSEIFSAPATVWSLGLFLFELVCGHLPFGSEEEIVHGDLSFGPDLSPGEKIHKQQFS